ncbi:MAG: hypothetical protein ACOCWR_04715 [Oceanidesulfovibrio sp.]
MTPKRAKAWVDEVEAMLAQGETLSPCQATELQATHRAANALLARARLDARRLIVVDGRVVCQREALCA